MSVYRKQQLYYLIADVLSSELIWLSFLLFRWIVYEGRLFASGSILIPAFNFHTPLIVYPLACITVYYLSGYYLRPFNRSYSQELLTTFFSSVLLAIGAFFVIIIDDQVSDYQNYLLSLSVLFILQFTICYIPRVAITIYSRRHSIKQESVIIDIAAYNSEQEIYSQIRDAYPSGKPIYIRPRVYDMLTGAARIMDINNEALVCITDLNMPDWEICVKRASDVVLSLLSLIVLSPLFCVLAVLVRCSSEGSVIYSQERIGHYGKPFRIYKFRTMYVSAEESGTPQITKPNDERITPIGRWMRYYRLDELPQLWNVLKGDMSLVGPRPERGFFIRQIEEQAPYYCLIYKIRPGLTSWGPIKVGYADTIEKMIARLNYDITYMENMSLLLDIRILFSTLSVIVKGQGQ